MRDASKEVVIEDKTYLITRMSAPVGSWVSNLLVAAMIKQQSQFPTVAPETPAENGLSPEEKAGGMVGFLWLMAPSSLTEEQYLRVQNKCLMVCRRQLTPEGGMIPVMNVDGRWADKELEQDAVVVNKLVIETLQFNIAPFFLEGVLGQTVKSV